MFGPEDFQVGDVWQIRSEVGSGKFNDGGHYRITGVESDRAFITGVKPDDFSQEASQGIRNYGWTYDSFNTHREEWTLIYRDGFAWPRLDSVPCAECAATAVENDYLCKVCRASILALRD